MLSCFTLLSWCLSLFIKPLNLFHQVAALIQSLSTVYAYKNKKAKAEQNTKHKEFLKQKEKEDGERQKRLKEERKKTFRAMGQKEKKKLKSSLKGASKDNWVYLNSHLILLDCDSRPIGSHSYLDTLECDIIRFSHQLPFLSWLKSWDDDTIWDRNVGIAEV